jgi:hypothetical protein
MRARKKQTRDHSTPAADVPLSAAAPTKARPGRDRGLEPLLAKEVTATAGPAATQVKGAAGCSVNDRESPWVTLFTGTWRARADGLGGPPGSELWAPQGCLTVGRLHHAACGAGQPARPGFHDGALMKAHAVFQLSEAGQGYVRQ